MWDFRPEIANGFDQTDRTEIAKTEFGNVSTDGNRFEIIFNVQSFSPMGPSAVNRNNRFKFIATPRQSAKRDNKGVCGLA